MDRVFRLSRGVDPTTGAEVDFEDDEKKDMLINENIRQGLKGKANRTSAVFKLFTSHPQGKQSFESWHREVYKAAKLIDWTDYGVEQAAVDAIVMQTSSVKLQQKAIQENPTFDTLVNLGVSQEQAKKIPHSLSDDENEDAVSGLQTEVTKLKQSDGLLKEANDKERGGGATEQAAKCEIVCNAMCKDPGEAACMAANENCIQCEECVHFAASKLCPSVENKFESGNPQAAQESDTNTETPSRIVDKKAVKSNSVVTKVGRN